MRTIKVHAQGGTIQLPEGFVSSDAQEILVVVESYSSAPVTPPNPEPWWEVVRQARGTMTGAEIDAYLKTEKDSWDRP